MRAFVRLRRILADNASLAQRPDELEGKYDVQFRVVFDAIRKLMQKPKPEPERRKIVFRSRTVRWAIRHEGTSEEGHQDETRRLEPNEHMS